MNSFNQSLKAGVCVGWRGGLLLGQPSPPYSTPLTNHHWPAPLAGCQPGVSWSMLVKRALIWVWQGNQQPNSTVKLNSVVEHRSASFMLRLQKGKVPQHQFVTESCSTELALATKQRERERERGEERGRKKRGSVYVCISVSVCARLRVAKSLCCLLLHPHRLPTTAGEKEGFTSVVWVGWMREKEEKTENERG